MNADLSKDGLGLHAPPALLATQMVEWLILNISGGPAVNSAEKAFSGTSFGAHPEDALSTASSLGKIEGYGMASQTPCVLPQVSPFAESGGP